MSINLKEVKSRRDLRTFITFPEKLYKKCENWVPALLGDEFDTLTPEKNAAFDFCEAKYWLAYDESGKVVGRVAGIINHESNKRWNKKDVRFGWIDFINDLDVVCALIEKVREWGREKGMEHIVGPLGFTDMDKEGLLVDGYERLSPFTCLYNYPYYGELLEKAGFSKDIDWIQNVVEIPSELPPMFQYAELVEKKYGIHAVKPKSVKELGRKYGLEIFHLYNKAFAPLYEFSPLTDRQIKRYLQTYVPILDPDFTCVLVDRDDKPIGFCFCVPTLSKAVKKSGGRLFPFGLFRILKALKNNDTLEALLIGILPEYQGKGASVLIFKHIHENCIRRGVTRLLVNPQLETNYKVQSVWSGYDTSFYQRRRSYIQNI